MHTNSRQRTSSGNSSLANINNQKAALTHAYLELSRELSSSEIKVVGNYTLGPTIGEGTYGRVRLATHRILGVRVAVKQIPKGQDLLPQLTREIHHHRRLHHPHIMQLYEVLATESWVWLVSELCAGGELYEYLVERGTLSESESRRIVGQLVLAIAHCHERGIVHRDLKLENVLLDGQLNVKLGDFGFTREFERGKLLETFCGSTGYAAPEMLQGLKYAGEPVDIWSIGIILYTLLCGELPFDDDDEEVMKRKICHSDIIFPDHVSSEARSLVQMILDRDPTTRPRVHDILAHPWFSKGHGHSGTIPLDHWHDSASSMITGQRHGYFGPATVFEEETFAAGPSHTLTTLTTSGGNLSPLRPPMHTRTGSRSRRTSRPSSTVSGSGHSLPATPTHNVSSSPSVPWIDYLGLLTDSTPAPMTTPMEKALLANLAAMGISTKQMMHSVEMNACDSASATWWMLVQKAKRREGALDPQAVSGAENGLEPAMNAPTANAAFDGFEGAIIEQYGILGAPSPSVGFGDRAASTDDEEAMIMARRNSRVADTNTGSEEYFQMPRRAEARLDEADAKVDRSLSPKHHLDETAYHHDEVSSFQHDISPSHVETSSHHHRTRSGNDGGIANHVGIVAIEGSLDRSGSVKSKASSRKSDPLDKSTDRSKTYLTLQGLLNIGSRRRPSDDRKEVGTEDDGLQTPDNSKSLSASAEGKSPVSGPPSAVKRQNTLSSFNFLSRRRTRDTSREDICQHDELASQPELALDPRSNKLVQMLKDWLKEDHKGDVKETTSAKKSRRRRPAISPQPRTPPTEWASAVASPSQGLGPPNNRHRRSSTKSTSALSSGRSSLDYWRAESRSTRRRSKRHSFGSASTVSVAGLGISRPASAQSVLEGRRRSGEVNGWGTPPPTRMTNGSGMARKHVNSSGLLFDPRVWSAENDVGSHNSGRLTSHKIERTQSSGSERSWRHHNQYPTQHVAHVGRRTSPRVSNFPRHTLGGPLSARKISSASVTVVPEYTPRSPAPPTRPRPRHRPSALAFIPKRLGLSYGHLFRHEADPVVDTAPPAARYVKQPPSFISKSLKACGIEGDDGDWVDIDDGKGGLAGGLGQSSAFWPGMQENNDSTFGNGDSIGAKYRNWIPNAKNNNSHHARGKEETIIADTPTGDAHSGQANNGRSQCLGRIKSVIEEEEEDE